MENHAGKLIFFIDEEGNPIGKGHYQRWDNLDINRFEKVSTNSVSWDVMPSVEVACHVHKFLGIPAIDEG